MTPPSRISFIVFWGIVQSTLRLSIVDGSTVTLHEEKFDSLDEALLPLLHKLERRAHRLGGIAVVTAALGSFASSRILLATCNAFAWCRDIPLAAIPAEWAGYDARRLSKELHALFRTQRRFTSQLVPQYRYPARITPSKKRSRFTMG